jgi:hypothetical protein
MFANTTSHATPTAVMIESSTSSKRNMSFTNDVLIDRVHYSASSSLQRRKVGSNRDIQQILMKKKRDKDKILSQVDCLRLIREGRYALETVFE